MAKGANLAEKLVLDYQSTAFGLSYLIHADCFEWLSRIPENSLHAIVTAPPPTAAIFWGLIWLILRFGGLA